MQYTKEYIEVKLPPSLGLLKMNIFFKKMDDKSIEEKYHVQSFKLHEMYKNFLFAIIYKVKKKLYGKWNFNMKKK